VSDKDKGIVQYLFAVIKLSRLKVATGFCHSGSYPAVLAHHSGRREGTTTLWQCCRPWRLQSADWRASAEFLCTSISRRDRAAAPPPSSRLPY